MCILDDVEFLRDNYRSYFDSISIRERDSTSVLFDLIPLNDPKRYDIESRSIDVYRIVSVRLSHSSFTIVSDTHISAPGKRIEYVTELSRRFNIVTNRSNNFLEASWVKQSFPI